MTTVAGTEPEAWTALMRDLGLSGASVGDRVETAGDDAPALSGTVEHLTGQGGEAADHHDLLLRSEESAAGFVSLGTFAWGGTTYASVAVYRYGEPGGAAPEGVDEEERAWRDWLAERA